MKVRKNQAYEEYVGVVDDEDWKGLRVKSIRDQVLVPGGRTRLKLFERATEDGRSHPRMRAETPPAPDPQPPKFDAQIEAAPVDPSAIETWLQAQVKSAQALLTEDSLEEFETLPPSARYFRNSVLGQRKTALFEVLSNRLTAASTDWPEDAVNAAWYVLRSLEDEAFTGAFEYDDADTGTYHSFREDAPFVHYLQSLLDGLPEEGTKPFVILPPEQQAAVARQRQQAQNHLDYLMRYKYAFQGIEETDIERSLGGFLIDRKSRHIVSEHPDFAEAWMPEHALLRVRSRASEHGGEWLYRDKAQLFLQDGQAVSIDAKDVRTILVGPDNITFRRAPNDERLRAGCRFDWDDSGHVDAEPIDWLEWAGHCDVKATMEALGLTLEDQTPLVEFRSDTGAVTTYDRNLLIEMLASMMELGSDYLTDDEGELVHRGKHRLAGARHDDTPDRLRFLDADGNAVFVWPTSDLKEDFVVKALHIDGELAELSTVFMRNIPDVDSVTFAPNPRFIEAVEGDGHRIDITGAKLTARVPAYEVDDGGDLRRRVKTVLLDLGDESAKGRDFLGSYVADAEARQIGHVYLDYARPAIVTEMHTWVKEDGAYVCIVDEEAGRVIDLPPGQIAATLSREMKYDDPSVFRHLLEEALRRGHNICADSDMKAEVWNGVITRIDIKRQKVNRKERCELWRADIDARFGQCSLRYLVHRDTEGRPVEYCSAVSEAGRKDAPDFLWQNFFDIGTKGVEDGEWLINASMLARGIVRKRWAPWEEGGFHVEDDHIKNVFELLFTALHGFEYSIVHLNKRYAFENREDWEKAQARLLKLRDEVRFQGRGSRSDWPD